MSLREPEREPEREPDLSLSLTIQYLDILLSNGERVFVNCDLIKKKRSKICLSRDNGQIKQGSFNIRALEPEDDHCWK